MSIDRPERIKMTLIFFWLVFTVAFAIWWLQLSREHIALLARLQPTEIAHWQKQDRMILWEGSAWLVLLISGGAALITLVLRERQRALRIREFFASFTHDVKTSLASLRVQTEALQDDWVGPVSPVMERLIGDTVRLQLQLENSLYLSSEEDVKLYFERVRLSEVIERMREQWPQVSLNLQNEATLIGDDRALRTIFSNLIKNALVHGKATEISISAEVSGRSHVRVRFHDNGSGFEGSLVELGQLFHRPKSTSGSGLGLYICRTLAERMNGCIGFHADNHGFRVELDLAGELR